MKILICVAGMPYAKGTVRCGRLVAKATGARVGVLTVLDRTQDVQQAQATLDQARQMLEGLVVKTKVRRGLPAEEILRETEEGQYDLVVIGAREELTLAEHLLGSVARQIVHRATVPVLVVRGACHSLARLLICTGGRAYSEPAIKVGTELAKATGAWVTILHVVSPVPTMYTGLREMEEHIADFLQRDTPEARHLKQVAELLEQHGVQGELELRHGVVADEILREAWKGGYDLIVVGSSYARGGISRYLLGDVTRQIVEYSTRPVLVVPPPKSGGG